MIAKIIKIGIVGLLAAALIGGSAYVLLRPAEAQAEHGSRGRRSEQASEPDDGEGKGYGAANNLDKSAGSGNGKGSSSTPALGKSAGRDYGAGGKGGPMAEPRGGGGYADEKWLTVTGEVTALDDELVIETVDGEMAVHLGPEWYWKAEGIALNPGDEVEVTGFYDEGEFEVARIESLTTSESVILRDDSGRPVWVGRGRSP